MSIVDTWDWDKLDTSVYDEPIKMNANEKVQIALHEFEYDYGVRPNRITMGFNLVNELHAMFCPIRSLEEEERELKGVVCEYEGIPVDVDYINHDRLEVGFMVKWVEGKYEQ